MPVNEKLSRLLVEFNPFWKGAYQAEYKERAVYGKIAKLLGEPQIISLCGLRRVGKTTLMRKAISDLIQAHGADAVLYFSFDDFQGAELLEIIDTCVGLNGKEPKYLFFDEVQKLPNWAEKVKILYDTGKYKIVISGSETLFLKKGARESLAGRVYEFEVKGLSFSEYLGFVGKGHMVPKPLLYDSELKAEFPKYLLSGGFPEMAGKEDAELIRQYIWGIVRKIVFVDMARLYPIDNPEKALSILEILADSPGMLLDINSLSMELGISRQTVSKYLEYLELAHVIVRLFNYSRNRSTSERRLKKAYPAFLSTALSSRGEEYSGKVVEAVCAIQSGARHFWRDPYKNEVDLVLLSGKIPLPVEVKYREAHVEASGLSRFCRKFGCSRGIVATRGTRKELGTRPRISFLPAHEFLLRFSE